MPPKEVYALPICNNNTYLQTLWSKNIALWIKEMAPVKIIHAAIMFPTKHNGQNHLVLLKCYFQDTS